jgi:hypothetical protein
MRTKYLVITLFSILVASFIYPSLVRAEIKVSVNGSVTEGLPYTYSYIIKNEGTETIHTMGVIVPDNNIKDVTSFESWEGRFELVPFGRNNYYVVVWYSEQGMQPGERIEGFSFTSNTAPGKTNWGVSIDILPTSLQQMSYAWGVTVVQKIQFLQLLRSLRLHILPAQVQILTGILMSLLKGKFIMALRNSMVCRIGSFFSNNDAS